MDISCLSADEGKRLLSLLDLKIESLTQKIAGLKRKRTAADPGLPLTESGLKMESLAKKRTAATASYPESDLSLPPLPPALQIRGFDFEESSYWAGQRHCVDYSGTSCSWPTMFGFGSFDYDCSMECFRPNALLLPSPAVAVADDDTLTLTHNLPLLPASAATMESPSSKGNCKERTVLSESDANTSDELSPICTLPTNSNNESAQLSNTIKLSVSCATTANDAVSDIVSASSDVEMSDSNNLVLTDDDLKFLDDFSFELTSPRQLESPMGSIDDPDAFFSFGIDDCEISDDAAAAQLNNAHSVTVINTSDAASDKISACKDVEKSDNNDTAVLPAADLGFLDDFCGSIAESSSVADGFAQ